MEPSGRHKDSCAHLPKQMYSNAPNSLWAHLLGQGIREEWMELEARGGCLNA